MMRVTNSMIVKRTKTNINNNRAKVDYTNNQMSTQKKITKPSDNPIIAIRSLRLRSTLSTITQYYENNIPDAESWMDCTETALVNMKDLLTDAYSRVVYGATDELETEDRQTILKALQSLQQQIYCEGNADYARRTVFTGYKTDQSLTFTSNSEAKEQHYTIEERFDYQDVEKKNYYANAFHDTSDAELLKEDNTTNPPTLTGKPGVFEEVPLNRLRLAYDKVEEDNNALSISYKDSDGDDVTTKFEENKITVEVKGGRVTVGKTGNVVSLNVTQPASGYHIDATTIPNTDGTYIYSVYKQEDWNNGTPTNPPVETVKVVVKDSGEVLSAGVGDATPISYRVTDTSSLRDANYAIGDNEIVFDKENGELIFKDGVAEALDHQRASIRFDYEKKGFEEGELRPEYYFNCTKYTSDKGAIDYTDNYDEDGNWKTQGIYYNIAGGQQMQINTEAREVFNSDIRRDIDELIDIVSTAITAQTTVDDIKKKIDSGNYTGDKLQKLNEWYDAAKKQLDYAKQNMHDTYSSYISRFQGYLDDVNLEITDLGGRGERVALTKNRMSVQQSTFKELKSINEDMDLSDLVINYTAASVAYQAALQAAAKIGQMTLLDFMR